MAQRQTANGRKATAHTYHREGSKDGMEVRIAAHGVNRCINLSNVCIKQVLQNSAKTAGMMSERAKKNKPLSVSEPLTTEFRKFPSS